MQSSYNLVEQHLDLLAQVITKFSNASLKPRQIPDKLKSSIITPIFQEGSKKKFENYRSITVLSCIEKNLGKIFSQTSCASDKTKWDNQCQSIRISQRQGYSWCDDGGFVVDSQMHVLGTNDRCDLQ